jgi:hypothetical protein
MKINNKIALAAISSVAVAGVGISAGIALAAPAAPAGPRSSVRPKSDQAQASDAVADAQATPKRPTVRKTDQWVTVRAGQTLKSIAAAHHMSWQAVYATPPNTRYLRDHATLRPGVRLRLPADPQLREADYVRWQHREAARREAARDAATAAAAQAPATQPATQTQPSTAQPSTAQPSTAQPTGGSLTAGMSAFEQCVAYRESGDNPTASSAGLFGILPATWASLGYSGTAGQASVAQQEAAFSRLYAQDGTAPWAPYDGC